jgi:hypothetical protein
MCKCVFFCSNGRPETRSTGGAKNFNEINAVKKSAIFLCACIYPYRREFRGKKTTTQLRLFKAAQLCLLDYQHCGVLALKDPRLQGWKLALVLELNEITTQSSQHW